MAKIGLDYLYQIIFSICVKAQLAEYESYIHKSILGIIEAIYLIYIFCTQKDILKSYILTLANEVRGLEHANKQEIGHSTWQHLNILASTVWCMETTYPSGFREVRGIRKSSMQNNFQVLT